MTRAEGYHLIMLIMWAALASPLELQSFCFHQSFQGLRIRNRVHSQMVSEMQLKSILGARLDSAEIPLESTRFTAAPRIYTAFMRTHFSHN